MPTTIGKDATKCSLIERRQRASETLRDIEQAIRRPTCFAYSSVQIEVKQEYCCYSKKKVCRSHMSVLFRK